MDALCPYCMTIIPVNQIEKEEIIVVRTKDILVLDKYLQCTICDMKFDDFKSHYDVLKEAYLEYNRLYPDNPIKIKSTYDVQKDMEL